MSWKRKENVINRVLYGISVSVGNPTTKKNRKRLQGISILKRKTKVNYNNIKEK